jgi:glycosyltransferase involved in cell wall biosynthesis
MSNSGTRPVQGRGDRVEPEPALSEGHGRDLRIGVMLRSLDEKGGIGVYTRGILDQLLEHDSRHEYVLFYRNPANLGRYAGRPNVTERVVRAPHQTLWDQVAIPLAARRERIDVLFHPKFTVPLVSPCPAVMVVHGADWFIPEHAQFYGRFDVAQIKLLMPLYFRRSAAVISVSELTTRDFNRVLGIPPGKVKTVYFAPAKHFRRIEDPAVLEAVREKYSLPDSFILTLTKLSGGTRKNFAGVVQAYRRYHGTTPHKLVVGGKDCALLKPAYGIPDDGWGADVHFPGWIDQRDLPAVYSLADLYLYPSNLEAFPIPITEAMSCGTPIVTSDRNGLEEIAGEGALRVDASDPEAIREAMASVLTDPARAAALSVAGLERSGMFSWDRCGEETLRIIEEAAGARPRAPVASPG